MNSYRTIGLISVVALALVGCTKPNWLSPSSSTTAQPSQETTMTTTPTASLSTTASPSASSATSATHTAPTEAEILKYDALAKDHIVRITTDKGTIDLELYPDSAPVHVANFLKLIDSGFYTGLNFHRVEPGFVIQGGDPNGDGTGGPGYTIKAEFNERKHELGSLAMARSSDPDSAGSQFYITLAPQPFLDGKYTVFGKTIAGMDVVQKIQIGDVMRKVEILAKS